MTATISMDIEKRDESMNPRQLRAAGKLPGTIYGKGMDSISVQLDKRQFVNTYKNNKDAIYELKINGKTYKTVVQDVQKEYKTMDDMNVQFKVV